MLSRVARKHHSQALEADALHFSTDIWSSAVVILGVLLVWLSDWLGAEWAWLAQADALAALVVAGIVVWVSLQLGRRAVSVLLDAAPPGLVGQIAAEASQVPGVQSLGPVRVRQAGPYVFVDLTVNVDRSASLQEAHQVAEAVDDQVSKLVYRGDVVVHVDPVRRSEEDLSQTVSAIASRLGLRTHDVHAHEVRGRYYVDLHVEVPADLSLKQAHDHVTQLEAAVRKELPHVEDIHSHIEPDALPVSPNAVMSPQEEAALGAQLSEIAGSVSGLRGCDKTHIRSGPQGYDVVIHCLADPNLPIAKVHRLTDEAEKRILAQLPAVSQVLIHVEPGE
jgi:divalent metal cation (Fe/Co/Zn/Cd) transporter